MDPFAREEEDPLTINRTPTPTGSVIAQAQLQAAPNSAPEPPAAAPVQDVADFAQRAPAPAPQETAAQPDAPDPYARQEVATPTVLHRRQVDDQQEQAVQERDQVRAERQRRQDQAQADKQYANRIRGLKDAGVELDFDPTTGESRPRTDATGRILYKPAVIEPFHQDPATGDVSSIHRNVYGETVQVPLKPVTDVNTGERMVTGPDGVTKMSLGIDEPFLEKKDMTEAGKVAGFAKSQLWDLKSKQKALKDQQKALTDEIALNSSEKDPTPEQKLAIASAQQELGKVRGLLQPLQAQHDALVPQADALEADYREKQGKVVARAQADYARRNPDSAIARAMRGETEPTAEVPASVQAVAEKPTVPESGDFMRGAKVSLLQIAPLAKGTLALLGATAEKALGTGGNATALKEWGLKGYADGMAKAGAIAHENDDVTKAWEKAKDGDVGALVDWAKYGMGYLVGQAGETAAMSLIAGMAGAAATSETGPGAAIGGGVGAVAGAVAKGAVKTGIKGMIEGLVTKTAAKLAIKQAAETGAELSMNEAMKLAGAGLMRKEAARHIAEVTAMAGNSLMMEAGGIFPDAVEENQKKGGDGTLSGTDMARVWATSVAAAGVDTLTDKFGLDIALGRLKLGGGSRLASAVKTGVGASLTEGAGEFTQTVLERLGSGQSLTDEEGRSDIINSTLMGMLGGSALGGPSALLHHDKSAAPRAALAKQWNDENRDAPGFHAINPNNAPVAQAALSIGTDPAFAEKHAKLNDEYMRQMALRDSEDPAEAASAQATLTAMAPDVAALGREVTERGNTVRDAVHEAVGPQGGIKAQAALKAAAGVPLSQVENSALMTVKDPSGAPIAARIGGDLHLSDTAAEAFRADTPAVAKLLDFSRAAKAAAASTQQTSTTTNANPTENATPPHAGGNGPVQNQAQAQGQAEAQGQGQPVPAAGTAGNAPVAAVAAGTAGGNATGGNANAGNGPGSGRNVALPAALAGAKPKYSFGQKQFDLQFANDLDKAAYITAQTTRSKSDAAFLKHVMDATGMSEDEVRAHGRRVRESIKAVAKDAPAGVLQVADHAPQSAERGSTQPPAAGQPPPKAAENPSGPASPSKEAAAGGTPESQGKASEQPAPPAPPALEKTLASEKRARFLVSKAMDTGKVKRTLEALKVEIVGNVTGKFERSFTANFHEGDGGAVDYELRINPTRFGQLTAEMSDEQAGEYATAAISEELTHFAQFEAVRRAWESNGKQGSYGAAFEAEYSAVAKSMTEEERRAAQAAYPRIEGSQLGAEFVRQLIQQGTEGRITEATHAARPIIERILAVLKELLGNPAARSEALQRAYDSTKRVLDEIERGEQPAAEAESPAPPKAPETQPPAAPTSAAPGTTTPPANKPARKSKPPKSTAGGTATSEQAGTWKPIGKSKRGNTVEEDERGVRSYVENGIRVTESVGIIPGGGFSIPSDEQRAADFEPVAPAAENPAPEKPAGPPISAEADRALDDAFDGLFASEPGFESREILNAERALEKLDTFDAEDPETWPRNLGRGAERVEPSDPETWKWALTKRDREFLAETESDFAWNDAQKKWTLDPDSDLEDGPGAFTRFKKILSEAQEVFSERQKEARRRADDLRHQVETQGFLYSSEPVAQRELPEEKIGAFVAAARALIKSGIETPAGMAAALEAKFQGKARPFSEALWDAFGMVKKSLRGTHDWNEVYGSLAKAAKPDGMTFEEFRRQYREAFRQSQKYSPDEVGASTHMDRMAELSDAHPEWAARVEAEDESKPAAKLHETIRDLLVAGEAIDRRRLAELAKESGLDTKQIDEAAELGVVMAAREIAQKPGTAEAKFDQMTRLYQNQPNLTAKTSTSKINQAYSTPMPLAFVASEMARIGGDDSVYEPTAGNGALLIEANPARVVANEIDPSRNAALKSQGFGSVTDRDAARFTPTPKTVDRVMANPPFGTVKDDNGESQKYPLVKGESAETDQIDHAISLHALTAMKDDGRAVLIIGGTQAVDRNERRAHYATGQRGDFFKKLYAEYGVIDHFTVDGDLYKKQGAGWPVDVITIAGRKPSPIQLPNVNPPRILTSWDELKSELSKSDEQRIAEGQYNEQQDRGEIGASLAGIRAALGDRGRTEQPGTASQPERGPERGAGEERAGGVTDAEPGTDSAEPVVRDAAGEVDRVGAGSVDERESGRRRLPVTQAKTDEEKPQFHKKYRPVSKGASFDIETPANLAEPQRSSLEKIEQEVGKPLKEYVAEKTGYPDGYDISQHFAAEQIDALASGVRNLETGGALILGDMAGVGKGRVVAGLIEYARKEGITPVFVTKGATLYSAMLADFHNIGRTINPLFTNNDLSLVHPITSEAIRTGNQKPLMNQMERTGKIPTGYDAIFTTYDQIGKNNDPAESKESREAAVASGGTPMPGDRVRALQALARGGKVLLLLDESHLGAGASTQGQRLRAMIAPDNVQAYYSSATFAKRPDAMPLYFKTNLRKAASSPEELMAVFEKGGAVMQQVASRMLAEDGQYIRRERTFDGVPFETRINVETEERDRKLANEYTRGLRGLLDMSNRVKEATKSMNEIMARLGKKLSVPTIKVEAAEFASQIHNFVSQYLFAIKAEAAAQQAIQAIKEGHATKDGTVKPHKVIVAVQNTMEGPISDLSEAGQPLEFSSLLLRTLEGLRRIKTGGNERSGTATYIYVRREAPEQFKNATQDDLVKALLKIETRPDAQGNPTQVGTVQPAVAEEIFRRLVNQVFVDTENEIKQLDMGGMPLSPIDHIRQRAEAAGIRTGEITGRGQGIGPDGKVYSRSAEDISNRGQLATLKEFNNSNLDLMVINASGSTGISAHASEDFKRRDPRMMIVAQPHLDINEFVQTLGRIFRSGQVENPRYQLLQTALPAEKRPAAILAKKMTLLNANTTSNTDSEVSQGAKTVDIFNEYGDGVVWRFLADNPSFTRDLQYVKIVSSKGVLRPLGDITEDLQEDGKFARNVASYAGLLPVEDQDVFWEDVTNRYNAQIAALDQIGENKLKASADDLGAETVSKTVFTSGDPSGTSSFDSPSYLETVAVKPKTPPMEPAEVQAQAQTAAGTKDALTKDFNQTADAFRESYLAGRKERAVGNWSEQEPRERARLHAQQAEVWGQLQRLGNLVQIQTAGGIRIGAITGVELDHEAPLTPSKQIFTVANNTLKRVFKFPASQMAERVKDIDPATFEQQYQDTREDKAHRMVITGNLVAASAKLNGQGAVTVFTRSDGSVENGIILPGNFNPNAATSANVQDAQHADRLLRDGKELTAEDGKVKISLDGNGQPILTVPASQANGGKYWRDPALNAAMTGGQMVQRGANMVGRISNMAAVLDRLKKQGATLTYEADAPTSGLGSSEPNRSGPVEVAGALIDKDTPVVNNLADAAGFPDAESVVVVDKEGVHWYDLTGEQPERMATAEVTGDQAAIDALTDGEIPKVRSLDEIDREDFPDSEKALVINPNVGRLDLYDEHEDPIATARLMPVESDGLRASEPENPALASIVKRGAVASDALRAIAKGEGRFAPLAEALLGKHEAELSSARVFSKSSTDSESWRSWYLPGRHRVEVGIGMAGDERMMMHEVTHALTARKLPRNIGSDAKEGKAYRQSLERALRDEATPAPIKDLIDIYFRAVDALGYSAPVWEGNPEARKYRINAFGMRGIKVGGGSALAHVTFSTHSDETPQVKAFLRENDVKPHEMKVSSQGRTWGTDIRITAEAAERLIAGGVLNPTTFRLEGNRSISEKATANRPDLGVKRGVPYELGNLDEFMAGALTDKGFQARLNQVDGKEGKSLWQHLVDAIRRILGLDVRHGSLLEEALRAASDVMELPNAANFADTARGDAGLSSSEPFRAPNEPAKPAPNGADILESAMKDLPPIERKVLAMKLRREPVETIARVTKLNEKGVENAYQIALGKMQRARTQAESVGATFARALAEKNPRTIGRPDLANPATGPKSRRFVDAVDADRGETATREQKGVREEAAARLEAGYANERKRLLEAARAGESFGDLDTAMAKMIVSKEALRAVKAGTLDRVYEAAQFVNAYRLSGTEQARGMAMRRDWTKSPAERAQEFIAQALLTPPQKQRNRMEKDPTKTNQELQDWSRQMKRLKQRLKDIGFDIENMTDEQIAKFLEDKVKVVNAVRAIAAAKTDVWDALYEYWVSSILSGPATNVANVAGNTANAFWDFTAQRFAEAAVNLIANDPKSATFGEMRHIWAGFMPGMADGFRRALRSWREEVPVFDAEVLGRDATSEKIHANRAIPGKFGRIVRMPLRLLLAADEMSKSVTARMQVGAEAYRLAKEKGLEGPAMAEFMRAQMTLDSNNPSESWRAAASVARTLAFQEDLGDFGNSVIKLRDSLPGLRYFMPFIKTIANIFKIGIRKSPLGSANMIYRLGKGAVDMKWNGGWSYTRKEAIAHTAEQMLAWGMFAALAGLAAPSDDDDLPTITGTNPYKGTKKGERDLAYRTAPPTSIRIGGEWYNYGRVEPFATALSVMVDSLNVMRKAKDAGDFTKTLGSLMEHMTAQLKDKTFARGIGDVLNAIEDGSSLAQWSGNFATSWVPNIVRASAKETDDSVREQKIWGRGAEWGGRLVDRIEYNALPIAANAPPPKVDLWGREIAKETGISPATDFLYRLMSPAKMQPTGNVLPVDRAITKFNNAHPDEIFAPEPPDPKWQHSVGPTGAKKEITTYMTDGQYNRFLQMSGRMALARVQAAGINFDHPTREDLGKISKALAESHKVAKAKLWEERVGKL